MTDYIKSTNFASKDSLATGNPLKIVKGTEIDNEFNNIATAVATKADLNSPTFIGIPAAPTAAGGTNTTQLATTAFVQAALQAVYPVGSIYINAASSTNPATLLGFGTWTEFGAGRVLVGQNTADASFDVLEETGGSKDAIVVAHSHSASVSDPGHSHGATADNDSMAGSGTTFKADNQAVQTIYTNAALTGISVSISTTGSSGTNANLQPYVVVKMWKRTA